MYHHTILNKAETSLVKTYTFQLLSVFEVADTTRHFIEIELFVVSFLDDLHRTLEHEEQTIERLHDLQVDLCPLTTTNHMIHQV